jgi:hypothetical protein
VEAVSGVVEAMGAKEYLRLQCVSYIHNNNDNLPQHYLNLQKPNKEEIKGKNKDENKRENKGGDKGKDYHGTVLKKNLDNLPKRYPTHPTH